jgi:hypothetical protein
MVFNCYVLTTYAMGGNAPYHRTTFIPLTIAATATIALGMSVGRLIRSIYRFLLSAVRKWTTPPAVLVSCLMLVIVLYSMPQLILFKFEEYKKDAVYAQHWDWNDAYLRSQRGKALVMVSANEFIGWHMTNDPKHPLNMVIAQYYHVGAIETIGKESVADPH